MFVAIIVFVGLFLLTSTVKILKEYERGVVFRLGRVYGDGAKGPGLFLLVPFVNRMVKVDLRTVTMDVPPQDVITRDNVPARVTAVIYFRVVDPNKSVIEVENFVQATSQISQTTLRSVLGKKDLDDLLANREAINAELQTIIDEQTEPWGIKVSVIEVKDVEIPQQMQRAMSRQAESENARGGPRSSPQRANTRPLRGSVRPPTNWIARRPSSSDFSRLWPRSPPSRTRR
jgi:regulator of protease activity HflC (stomatin/prohibitin superfamily)